MWPHSTVAFSPNFFHFRSCFCLGIESDAEIKNFFTECSVMQTLKHPNVLGLLGMCFDSPDKTPLMVLPFMVNGNLKDYLKKHRGPQLQLETYPEVRTCTV